MSFTNNLKKQVDLPVWEWCRFAPAVSSALSSTCTADNSNFNVISGRYIYFTIAAASFWRYDTWTDTYEQLSSPLNAIVAQSSMRYSGAQGYFGRVISATSTTIQTGLSFGQNAKGFKIRIVSGTGAGQERLITSISDPVVADFGAASAAGSATTLVDSTKYWGTGYVGATWNINNWVGYTVRVTLGTGLMQTRKILYNSINTLYIGDATKVPEDPWAHTTWTASGIGSQYQIESSTITVDTAWNVTPDNTSRYVIQSGGLYLLSTVASTPWYTLQYYDVLADTWYVKPALTNMIAAGASDLSLERMTENSTIWTIGTSSTAGTVTTLTDSTQSWTTNQWSGYNLYIYSGTGLGQTAAITSNTATTLTFSTVSVAPDATSQYEILGYDVGIATGATYNTISDSTNSWTTNQYANFGVRILYGTGAGQMRQIQSNTATALTLYVGWNIMPDTTSVYSIQGDSDTMYFAWGGSSEIFKFRLGIDTLTHGRILDTGVASTLSCYLSDSSHHIFEQGPITISTITFVSTTATVTTANPHSLKVGQYVSVRGETSANATYYDGLHQIVTAPSNTTFTYTMSGTPGVNAVGVGTQSTTVLYDSTKDYRQTASGGTSGGYTITFANPTPSNINGWYVAGTGISTVGSTYCQVVSGAGTTTLTLSVANSGTVSGLITFNQWAPAATGTASSGTVSTVTVTMSAATPTYINGWYASGTGIGTGAYVVSGAGTTTLIMSVFNSGAVSGVITFSQAWNAATIVVGNTAAVTLTTGSAAGQAIQATSQTGNSITFPLSTAYTAGASRYAIVRRDMIGATAEGAFNPSYNSSIVTTGTSGTVFNDTSASITMTSTSSGNVAQGTTVGLTATSPANITGWYITGTGIGVGAQVISGAGTTTLTLSVPNSAAVTSAALTISAWYTNSLVGKRVKLLTSTGAGNTSEQTISANTTTQITVSATFGATPAATTAYSLLAAPARGAGIELQWASGMSDPTKRGKYFFCPRGGATVGFDRLDVTTDRWNLMYSAPAVETLSTGSMYAYDGGDRLYFTKENTMRVYYLDLNTNWIHGAGMYPYVAGTAIVGNRMEIFTTVDGLKYLWLNRHSNVECFKQLLFY